MPAFLRAAAGAFLLGVCILGCNTAGPRHAPAAARPERLVGISYSTWFPPVDWLKTWDRPLLGPYVSSDEFVIRQHALWLQNAGVDFLAIDWTNNTGADDTPEIKAIEESTLKVVDVLANFKDGPKYCFMLGTGAVENLGNGALQKKADQVYNEYIADKGRARIAVQYLGKPLLMVYVGAPSPWQDGPPPWDDPRFTVRWLTAFLEDQPALLDERGFSRFGYWSWWERTPQHYALSGGRPECVTVSAAYQGPGGWKDEAARGRRNGDTFMEQWSVVPNADPHIVFINSWNEWSFEERDLEHSNDIEPAHKYQYQYLQMVERAAGAWRAMPRAPFPPSSAGAKPQAEPEKEGKRGRRKTPAQTPSAEEAKPPAAAENPPAEPQAPPEKTAQ